MDMAQKVTINVIPSVFHRYSELFKINMPHKFTIKYSSTMCIFSCCFRIYVDAVINHMTGGGNGRGSAGSSWSGDNQDFPGVPFSNWDFHGRAECSTHSLEIENYQDPVQVRNCRLSGLRDLKHSKPYVSQKIVEFMNNLINMGVAGFRVDAVKHMWPGDTSNIMNRLANLNTRWFPGGTRPFVFQEVIDQGGEPITASQYTHIGRVTEFKYSIKIGEVFRGANGQKLAYLRNFGEGWGFMGGASAAVFVDNHDNQRGHGGGGDLVLNFKSSRRYKMASAFMLAWEYGYPRLMSSYNFDTDWRGPPSDGSGNTNDVPINGDGTCSGGWMCEHRWRQIANMVEFHNVAVNNRVANWWSNNGNQIAFSRGNRAFIAMNLEGYKLQQNLATGLQSGAYCDVISGEKSGGRCSGKTIHVGSDGRANISIEPGSDNNSFYDSFIAIHANSKL